MTFRPFNPKDIPEIEAIYAENGKKDERELAPLPDLRDPSRSFAFVVEDGGKVRAAFVYRTVVEVITMADSPQSWLEAVSHHQEMRELFKKSRIRTILTWTPRKSVGRVLKRLGFWKVPADTEAWTTNV